MIPYNTHNPLGSTDPRDLFDNAHNFDLAINDITRAIWLDRFGVERRTWYGLELQVNNAAARYGYTTLMGVSFTTGATVNLNELLLNPANGFYYKWTGTFPAGGKMVPPNSSPASTGGEGAGKWVNVGDSSVRSALAMPDGATMIGYGGKKVAELLPLFTSMWNIDNNHTPQQNAQKLISLIDYAISSGRLLIDVDVDATVDDINVLIRKKTEVFFRSAGGEITGLYRRGIINPGTPSNVRLENGLCQAGMLQFYSATSPKIVTMGDSIDTDGPNALANSDSMSSIIYGQIKKHNPGIAIDFINRAIGGQTWLNANTKPTAFPAWYQDTSKDWLEYVKAESPDLLILAFGMNDANGFNAGALHSVVNKIKTWDKVPSLLFVTNPVPSMATTLNDNYYITVAQEGRDWAAGYARSYANFYGYSLLDMNRQFCLVRDGRDYSNVPLERLKIYNQSYMHDTSVTLRDFSFQAPIASWPVGKVLTVAVSVNVGSETVNAILVSNVGGKYKITGVSEGSATPYFETQTTVTIVTGATFEFSVQNNKLTIFSGITKVIETPIIRMGGELAAVAEWQDAPSNGPFSSITLNGGNFLQCEYTARDSDIWGHDNGTADTKLPEGGNGINHYSSKGLQLVVAPVVGAFDFRRKVIQTRRGIDSLNTGVTALTTVTAIRTGSHVSLTGRIKSTTAAPYKVFDLPVGFRPSQQKIITTSCINGSTYEICILDIRPDGTVNLAQGNAGGFLSLDGVTFEI